MPAQTRKLARTIVSQAVLDFVALSFPEQCPKYLRRWYKQCYRHGGVDYELWRQEEWGITQHWLINTGQKLADLLDMDNDITRAFSAVRSGQSEIARQLEQSAHNGAVI